MSSTSRTPWSQRLRRDDGSTIPLVLGFFVVALLLVAGAVAASDAFVDQRAVQSVCDGATLAGAEAVNLTAVRNRGAPRIGDLPLGEVQAAAQAYLDRDADRSTVQLVATVSDDGRRVEATCTQTRPIAFGPVFGLGGGVTHRVTSSALTTVAR